MIRKITKDDRQLFLLLTHEFYHSPAVLHPVPAQVNERTFTEITSDSPYADGYILSHEGTPAGYALTATTYSGEVGGLCIWIEELYIREAFRSHGLGKEFFAHLRAEYKDRGLRFRLEVEPDNIRAIALYERLGYERLPYVQMVLDRDANP